MSFSYADMQARIASEMKRGDISSDSVLSSGSTTSIQAAIQSAIAQYQATRFYFNELAYATWPTIANQERYGTTDSVPSDIVEIDTLSVVYAGVRYPVRQQQWGLIETWQDGGVKGDPPTDFAYYGQKFRLYPIPLLTTNTLSLAYLQRVAAPTAGTDVGAWMNEAEELVRCSAKRRLYTHVVEDEAAAQLMVLAEADALRALKSETARRTGTGHIRATNF